MDSSFLPRITPRPLVRRENPITSFLQGFRCHRRPALGASKRFRSGSRVPKNALWAIERGRLLKPSRMFWAILLSFFGNLSFKLVVDTLSSLFFGIWSSFLPGALNTDWLSTFGSMMVFFSLILILLTPVSPAFSLV